MVKQIKYIIYPLILCAGIAIGYYLFHDSSPPQIIEKTEIKYKVIYRDPITDAECRNLLWHYDNDKPTLNIKFINDKTITASASLFQRDWNQEYTINKEVGSNGNWKYGVALGVGVCVGIYGTYKIIKIAK
jgi:uncharacterized protein YneF (UPF0154 family)